jgi:hypothetical protein
MNLKNYYSSVKKILLTQDSQLNQLKFLRELRAEQLKLDEFKLDCIK